MSDLEAQFATAQQAIKAHPRPSNDVLGQVYGLYKQATVGYVLNMPHSLLYTHILILHTS